MALDHNFPRSLYPTGDRRYHSLGGYVCSLLQFGKNGWIAGQRCSAYARELARVLARHPRPLNASESELSAVGQRPDLTAAIVNAVGSIQPARTRACRMMVSHCSRDTAVSPRIPGCIVTSSPRRSVHPTRSSVVQAARSSMVLMPFFRNATSIDVRSPGMSSNASSRPNITAGDFVPRPW